MVITWVCTLADDLRIVFAFQKAQPHSCPVSQGNTDMHASQVERLRRNWSNVTYWDHRRSELKVHSFCLEGGATCLINALQAARPLSGSRTVHI